MSRGPRHLGAGGVAMGRGPRHLKAGGEAMSRGPHRPGPLRPAALALLALLAAILLAGRGVQGQARVFYVATSGSDTTGDGTFNRPWATINHAMRTIPDEISTVVVGAGTYPEAVHVFRSFTTQTTLRAEEAYAVRLVASGAPVVLVEGSANLTITGLEITRPPGDDTPDSLVLLTDRLGSPSRRVSLRSNIVHGSRRGHLVEVQSGTQDVLVESNVLYDPGDGRSHLVLDGADGALVRENVLFDDYVAAGRPGDASASFIVVSNLGGSHGRGDRLLSREVIVDRNIFLGWQGAQDGHFLRLGGSGVAHREVDGLRLESNLFLGNSRAPMAAPLGLFGTQHVAVRANTIAGNLPAIAFVAEMDRRGAGPGNEDVGLYNNIFSDPNGTMGGLSAGDPANNVLVIAQNNLYWNGGRPVPDGSGIISVNADPAAFVDDPLLPGQASLVAPRWDAEQRTFAGGHTTFRAAFEALAAYAHTATGSAAIDHADSEHMPLIDLLGRPRGAPDIGALEHRPPPTPLPPTPSASRAVLPFLLRAR